MKKSLICLLTLAALCSTGCGRAEEAAKPAAKVSIALSAKPAAAALSKSVPAGWSEDFEAARTRAAAEKKNILLAFSGSDWCHWCVKMERDVYSKPDFVKAASEKFVLVMLDLPSDESILSPLAKRQNRALAEKYAVRGFPCSIVVDAKGQEVTRVGGYMGDPAAFLKRLGGDK